GLAEEMGAVNWAVLSAALFNMTLWVGQHLKSLADDRPALIAGDVRQLVALGRGEAERRRGHILHRHDDCSGWLTEQRASTERLRPAPADRVSIAQAGMSFL